MQVVIRTYTGQGEAELSDAMEQREEDVKELISGVPGFVSYAAFRGDDGFMTVTACQDKAGTDESSTRAARAHERSLFCRAKERRRSRVVVRWRNGPYALLRFQ